MHFWLSTSSPSVVRVFSLASRLRGGSAVHLPATCEQKVPDGQETFHRLLFLLLLLLLMPEPLMHAAACHTQGKTVWTEIKYNLSVWVCGKPSAELLFIVESFLTFCLQVASWCHAALETLLCWANAINTLLYSTNMKHQRGATSARCFQSCFNSANILYQSINSLDTW